MRVYHIVVYKSTFGMNCISRYFEVTALDHDDAVNLLRDFLESDGYKYRNIGFAFFQRYGELSLFDPQVIEISQSDYYGDDHTKSELKLNSF